MLTKATWNLSVTHFKSLAVGSLVLAVKDVVPKIRFIREFYNSVFDFALALTGLRYPVIAAVAQKIAKRV